ncbi:MAG TPA: hypothetical protein PKV80_19485, partial [Leptospiraceae bacterium]|nr:hypothetical protein [Leptospiraceae bacterium]
EDEIQQKIAFYEKEMKKAFNRQAKIILQNHDYFPIVESLGLCSEKWSVKLIQDRSRILSKRVWETLSPWLGY